MHAIVIGCGRVGSGLAASLSGRGEDVVVVDQNARSFHRLGSAFNGVTLRGTGTDEEVLLRAGIDHADALVAATNSDSANMVAAEIARRMYHVPRVVIRLYMPDKATTAGLLELDYVGDADLTVRALLDKLDGGVLRTLDTRGDTEIVEFTAGPAVHGRTAGEIETNGELRVCLVTRSDGSFVPLVSTRLVEGDRVTVSVRTDTRRALAALAASGARGSV